MGLGETGGKGGGRKEGANVPRQSVVISQESVRDDTLHVEQSIL